ncbi:MAG TPA: hypothetical protein VGD35_02850 [Chitinophaga sp.]
MAKLDEDFEFKGKSVYRMKGSDKLIVRKKGGPRREQVLKSPRFERTRENAMEFTGVVMIVAAIRSPLFPVRHLADYNFTSTLNKICKEIQLLDTTGDRGQRCIFLSQQRYMLKNFWLNKKHPFPIIVAEPVSSTLNRETKTAVIQLPMLLPGINLHLPWKHPLYRFIFSLGPVSDVVYENGAYINNQFEDQGFDCLDTAWHLATDPFQAQTLELRLNMPQALKESQTLVLAIGIEMGTPGANGKITEVKYCGSACILAVG